MEGLSTCQMPQVSHNTTISLFCWPFFGHLEADLAPSWRYTLALIGEMQLCPHPFKTYNSLTQTGNRCERVKHLSSALGVTTHDTILANVDRNLAIWRPIWRQAYVIFWRWEVRCSCIYTISRTTTLKYRHMIEIKEWSNYQVPRVSQRTTKYLQMLTFFVHLEADLGPSWR